MKSPGSQWMAAVVVIGCALLSGPGPVAADAPPTEPVVRVQQGTLVGVSEGNVQVFKGVPYATPPVGMRRWRPPEAAPSWQGRRFAMSFAPECAQSPYPEESFFSAGISPNSEDCLYLNVWSATLDTQARRPVMVWLHGGGLTRGSGASP